MQAVTQSRVPFKSSAIALLMAAILGPVGLLYASVWGGVVMFMLLFFAYANAFHFIAFLLWFSCCVWAAVATERYNQSLYYLLKN